MFTPRFLEYRSRFSAIMNGLPFRTILKSLPRRPLLVSIGFPPRTLCLNFPVTTRSPASRSLACGGPPIQTTPPPSSPGTEFGGTGFDIYFSTPRNLSCAGREERKRLVAWGAEGRQHPERLFVFPRRIGYDIHHMFLDCQLIREANHYIYIGALRIATAPNVSNPAP